MNYLILMWKKELDTYRTECAKAKDKNLKALMKPLTLIEKNPPIFLFKNMIYRSKIVHSLAFF